MSAIPPPSKPVQSCADPNCSQPSAYRTRSRDAWCDGHITEILRTGGVEPLEPFQKPTAWRLTRCLSCGCEAHYRFEYTLANNALDEPTCRACFWRQWALDARRNQGPYADLTPVPVERARAHAEQHGYEYLAPLTEPSLEGDPHHVRCRHCGRQAAERLGDIAFGCRCGTNPSRARQTSNAPGEKKRELLKDSGLPVLDWWDHEANDAAQWETVTVTALREAAWRCPDCGLRFRARVSHMLHSRQCPDCEPKRRAERDDRLARLAVTPVAEVPELLAAWADEDDPHTVTVAGDHWLRRFRCPQGHHPRVTPLRYLESGCPSCRSRRTAAARKEAEAAVPFRLSPELAGQWHPTRNGRLRLATISPGSRRTAWWQDPVCGHEWEDTPEQREKGHRLRCPECRTILDSLAFHFPELAAEWSPANPLSAWQVRPTAQTTFVPAWLCSADAGHTWQAPLASRANGSGCPECREHGKSQVELSHHRAAERAFGAAASGQSVRHPAFARRASWTIDISVPLPDGRTLAIEYDGAYWHADKAALDTDKSRDLLAAGHLVARLREHPLPPLPVRDPGYAEFTVHSSAPRPDEVIAKVLDWASHAGS